MNNALIIFKASCKYSYRRNGRGEKVFYVPNVQGMPIIGEFIISIILIALIPYFLVNEPDGSSIYTSFGNWILFFAAFWLVAIYILISAVRGVYQLTKLAKSNKLKKKLKSNYFTF